MRRSVRLCTIAVRFRLVYQIRVIPSTGGGKSGTATGDTYVAFALPDNGQ